MKFYVVKPDGVKENTASDDKCLELVKLIFPGQKVFGVKDGKIDFAQNMTLDEAATVCPVPLAVVKKPAKTKLKSKVKAKPTKKPVKKTKLKKKVVVKKPAKKTKLKKKVAKKKVVVKKKVRK